jgi:hypothetical protein
LACQINRTVATQVLHAESIGRVFKRPWKPARQKGFCHASGVETGFWLSAAGTASLDAGAGLGSDVPADGRRSRNSGIWSRSPAGASAAIEPDVTVSRRGGPISTS